MMLNNVRQNRFLMKIILTGFRIAQGQLPASEMRRMFRAAISRHAHALEEAALSVKCEAGAICKERITITRYQ